MASVTPCGTSVKGELFTFSPTLGDRSHASSNPFSGPVPELNFSVSIPIR